MYKFKIDENMPVEAAALLASAGHDASTVPGQRMGGQPDATIAAICQRESRVILTIDLDFADIRVYLPADYSGIIVLRLARLDKRRILSALQRISSVLDQQPLIGKLWIVDDTGVRRCASLARSPSNSSSNHHASDKPAVCRPLR